MRLINTSTLEFEEFLGSKIPKYAILSHTWEEEEVSYADYAAGRHLIHHMKGFDKIKSTCSIAAEQRIQYAWVDTCCIDKRSSAELTEAINCMFCWYERAERCYAFLSDLPDYLHRFRRYEDMKSCRWFTRGWTLQELIAPYDMQFYDSNWQFVGTKASLSAEISAITSIPTEILLRRESLSSRPVAERMAWASHRTTTRVEDIAYCLLGIFDVNMPLLYGEEKKAFQRLQEMIINSTTDLSVFLWTLPTSRPMDEPKQLDYYGILAESPACFYQSKEGLLRTRAIEDDFSMTSKGVKIRTNLDLCPIPDSFGFQYVLSVPHKHPDDLEVRALGVQLRKVGDGQFLRSDPWNLRHMRMGTAQRGCLGRHHLLLKAPTVLDTGVPSSGMTWQGTKSLLDSMPRTIRINIGANMSIQAVWPMSRFDEEEQIFFVTDEDNFAQDWGVVVISIQPKGGTDAFNGTPLVCMIFLTSWGRPCTPQCSVLTSLNRSQSMIDLLSQLRSCDHTTAELLSTLTSKQIMRSAKAVENIPGTPFAAVTEIKCLERRDGSYWAPNGNAWEANITCNIQRNKDSSSQINGDEWDMPLPRYTDF